MVSGVVLGGVMAISAAAMGADPSPADIIKARQGHYKQMGAAMKAIGDQLKSGTPDRAVVIENAKKIAAFAPQIPKWFPKGTGGEAGVKTAAKQEIWAQPEDFAAAAAKLPPEADKLVAVTATGDAASIGDQQKALVGACAGCHKLFRVKDEHPQ